MIPQILIIPLPGGFELPLNSFGLMIALAFIAATYRLAQSLRANGLDPALAERFVFAAAVAGLIGARLWYLISFRNELEGGFLAALFASGGFIFYGGFIAAIAVFALLCAKERISFSAFFDSTGPASVLGYAIGRLGCQLSGDGDYGIAAQGMLAMPYPTGVVPTPPGVEVYPTPLYESAACLLILPVLLRAERSPAWKAPWRRTGLYLVLLSIERFLIEFIRINARGAFGLSQAQFVALAACGVGVFLIARGKISPSAEAR